MRVDSNMDTSKIFLVEKYSVLNTDSIQDIEIKLKKILVDVLNNQHLLKKLDHPL